MKIIRQVSRFRKFVSLADCMIQTLLIVLILLLQVVSTSVSTIFSYAFLALLGIWQIVSAYLRTFHEGNKGMIRYFIAYWLISISLFSYIALVYLRNGNFGFPLLVYCLIIVVAVLYAILSWVITVQMKKNES